VIDPKAPPRVLLSPEVEQAARTISQYVWGHSYRPGEGVMHFAGGPWWHDELLARAEKWERLAKAARICADALPSGQNQPGEDT
jgi:hypothetical protein